MIGWNVYFPTDGLLLGQWNASAVDLLLGDGRLVLGLWSGQVPRGGYFMLVCHNIFSSRLFMR